MRAQMKTVKIINHAKVTVDLPGRSYPIYIGNGLLTEPDLIKQHLPSQQLLIVTNTTIAPLYLEQVIKAFNDYQCDTVILPDGEQYKTLETLNQIFNRLLEKGHDKTTLLCALGGGVIGDMTGFAAATYRRGVPFLQIPTTLLAQVDAAIGGKTAVNHHLGKNMIGAIHQPKSVIIDINTLQTLPEREYRAGMAEVIKYGLIKDENFFQWIEDNVDGILARQSPLLLPLITKCCEIKAEIVSRDEHERGERALLNLGHTFGHAIETATQYQLYLHGEAVAIGMMMAADLSHRHGWISEKDCSRIRSLIERLNLPTKPPAELDATDIYQLMTLDKKRLAKKMCLILLKKIGQATISFDFNQNLLWDQLRGSGAKTHVKNS